jgi:hypothetical protein
MKIGDDKTALAQGIERMKELGKGAEVAEIRSLHDFLEWRYRYVVEHAAKEPGSSYKLAQIAAATGRTGEALDALEQECRNGGETILFNYLAVEPSFDSLHKDPRFAKIIDCTPLPKDAPVRLTLKAEAGAR